MSLCDGHTVPYGVPDLSSDFIEGMPLRAGDDHTPWPASTILRWFGGVHHVFLHILEIHGEMTRFIR